MPRTRRHAPCSIPDASTFVLICFPRMEHGAKTTHGWVGQSSGERVKGFMLLRRVRLPRSRWPREEREGSRGSAGLEHCPCLSARPRAQHRGVIAPREEGGALAGCTLRNDGQQRETMTIHQYQSDPKADSCSRLVPRREWKEERERPSEGASVERQKLTQSTRSPSASCMQLLPVSKP